MTEEKPTQTPLLKPSSNKPEIQTAKEYRSSGDAIVVSIEGDSVLVTISQSLAEELGSFRRTSRHYLGFKEGQQVKHRVAER